MKTNEVISNSLDRVVGQLRSVIKDAENLLRTTEKPEEDAFKRARARFEATLNNAKVELLDMEHLVVEKVRDAAHTTDEFVHDNPWNMAATAAVIGLLAGLLITRK